MKKKSRLSQRIFLLTILLTVMALLLVACGGESAADPTEPLAAEETIEETAEEAMEEEAPAEEAMEEEMAEEPTEETMEETGGAGGGGGTLVVAIGEDPGQFNPGITTSFGPHSVADSIYNGLVELDINANPMPDLAESWEINEDATSYTFHLVQNATWHDGEPFTSADVKFTFENILLLYHSRTKAGLETALASIETPDEYTVVFNFNEPYAPLLQRLNVTEAPILPMHIYEGVEDPTQAEANLMPIGTGPFKFDSHIPGSEVRLVRNENYFKEGLPHLDEVVFRVIPDDNTQIAALEAGEVDYVWRIPGPDAARIEENPDTQIISVPSGPGGGFCVMTMTFNLEREVFQDVRVRQAFAYAIDRQQILEQVIFNQGKVAVAPISSKIAWAHLSDGPSYEYSPETANELLDEAGYPVGEDGTRFTVDFIHFPTFSKYGEVLREQLAEVGIDLELRPLERDAAIEAIFTERDFDTNIISYCNNTDPEIGVTRMYVSSNIGPIPFSNGATYMNPEVDALFAEAASTADRDTRAEAYHEIQRILLEELPYWWLVETDFSVGVSTNCTGFRAWSGQFAETATCS